MAKRKAARTMGRKTAGQRAGARQSRSLAAGSIRKGARKRSVRRTRAALRKSAARKSVRKTSRKATSRKTPRRRSGQTTTRKSLARGTRIAKSGERPAVAARSASKVPALNRERRVIRDNEIFPALSSSLDFDRSTLPARTELREVSEKLHHQIETSPALSDDDIDANWKRVYAVGNEKSKNERKISSHDKTPSELDPASSEDYNDR